MNSRIVKTLFKYCRNEQIFEYYTIRFSPTHDSQELRAIILKTVICPCKGFTPIYNSCHFHLQTSLNLRVSKECQKLWVRPMSSFSSKKGSMSPKYSITCILTCHLFHNLVTL